MCANNVYGGTPRLFNQVMANLGLEFSYVDTSESRRWRSARCARTRSMCALETPTNPLMTRERHQALWRRSRTGGAELIVDNTFMSPYFQRPLELGADMVMHSTTKFLNGHSDGLGGVIVCSTTGAGGAIGVSAEVVGRDSFAVRELADSAWREDACRPHGAAQSERNGGGAVSCGASQR